MALTNFVDKVSLITAAWLNGVDQLVNGSGAQQGAGLLEYTAAGVGVAPAGSVGAKLDALSAASGALDPLVITFGAQAVTPANTYQPITGAPNTTNRASAVVAYNSGTGNFSGPGGLYMTNIAFFPGYALATAAVWHFISPTDFNFSTNGGVYNNSLGGDAFNPLVNHTFFGFGTAFNGQIQLRCTTGNVTGSVQIMIVKLA